MKRLFGFSMTLAAAIGFAAVAGARQAAARRWWGRKAQVVLGEPGHRGVPAQGASASGAGAAGSAGTAGTSRECEWSSGWEQPCFGRGAVLAHRAGANNGVGVNNGLGENNGVNSSNGFGVNGTGRLNNNANARTGRNNLGPNTAGNVNGANATGQII